jgi:hypothetical protein
VDQEAPASSSVASDQPVTIAPDVSDQPLETQTEPIVGFSTHPGPESTVIEVPDIAKSGPQPTVVSIEPEDCKSEDGEEATRAENNVISIEDEPERTENNVISVKSEEGDKTDRKENDVISVEPESATTRESSPVPENTTVRKTLFPSSPQIVSINHLVPASSLKSILVSSGAPVPALTTAPAPPAPPAPLAAAKANLQSILKAQAKKFQAPPPPPKPLPLTPPLLPAPVSTAPSGPPMTALALLKARKAGLNVSAPMSTYVSTVVPTTTVTTHLATPTTSLATTPSPMSTPQSSPKKRSRKDVLVSRNSNAVST